MAITGYVLLKAPKKAPIDLSNLVGKFFDFPFRLSVSRSLMNHKPFCGSLYWFIEPQNGL